MNITVPDAFRAILLLLPGLFLWLRTITRSARSVAS
jgi:hypothetical protein